MEIGSVDNMNVLQVSTMEMLEIINAKNQLRLDKEQQEKMNL
jgi:hypothetical protein